MENLIVLNAVQKELSVSEVRKRSFAGETAGDMAGAILNRYWVNAFSNNE
jgi:hypothetical protein